MPAPAVYVIAIVGTVGVAIAFKEFIYPHIAPRIDRWKAEFEASKKRRAEAERSAVMAAAAFIHGAGNDGYQNGEGSDSDSDHSRAPAHPYMKNGLLIRRRNGRSKIISSNPGDVELDWIAGVSTATETGSQHPDLPPRQPTSFSPTASTSRAPTSIRSGSEKSSQTKLTHTPIELHAFLDESIQAIPYAPLSPIRTPTPTNILYNPSSTHSPLESPFLTTIPSPLPEEALILKLKTDVTNTSTSTQPLPASLQPPSPSPADTANASASKPESSPFLPVGVDGAMIPDTSVTSLLSVDNLSSPPALAPSSPSHSLSPTLLHRSPYQTPPHIHAIPSLSQSYPLDDLLDYEHGLELLSPPSPLSRTDSPFELAGLSPRPSITGRLLTRSEDGGEQVSAASLDSISNSTRSTTYLSLSSPALSASSVFPSSENGYENDSSPSEFSSTFSSPSIAPTRLNLGSESLPPHDQSRPSRSMSLLSSRSSPFDVNNPQLQPHLRQQQERNTGWASMRVSVPALSAPNPRPLESDTIRPMTTFDDHEYDDHADTQTLSPRNRTRSPWMMKRTETESIATASLSTETHPSESATRVPRTTRDSDFDNSSELSDLDFLNMSAEEYEASASAAAVDSGSLGLGSRSMVHTGADGGNGQGSAGGIGRSRTGDGNESDTSSWSLAGGSE